MQKKLCLRKIKYQEQGGCPSDGPLWLCERRLDGSVYERNREAADKENKYILRCMNTGKLCLFTSDGKMHQIKVMDLPYGKFRDKGFPIDNVK